MFWSHLPQLPSRPEVVVYEAWRDLGPARDLAERERQWDLLQLVAALQGLANRRGPRLYLNLVGDQGSVDAFWWRWISRPGAWMSGARVQQAKGVDDLLQRFRSVYKGVAVWDQRVPATSNVAASLAGVEDALPVRFDPSPSSLYSKLVTDPAGPRLRVLARLLKPDGSPLFTGRGAVPGTGEPSSGSAKCDAYLWAVDNVLRRPGCDATRMGYYPDAFWLQTPRGLPVERTLLSNEDYFVAHRGFFFDLSPWGDEAPDDDPGQPLGADVSTLGKLLRAAWGRSGGRMIHVGGFTPWDQKYTDFTGRHHGGVPTEWRYAEFLSCFNAYMDADAPGLGPMANASFFQHYPLRARYRQSPLPSDAEMRAKGWIGADGLPLAKPFAAFYAGDFDSAAWLYRMLPELWQDPARGKAPVGWAFDPNLQDRFPVGLAFARETASANDVFITGDSGAGYLNPGYLVPPRKWSGLPSGLAAWERHSAPLYEKWDLKVTGFVIDGNAPPMTPEVLRAYAAFSPGGIVAQKVPPESLVGRTPVLRMGPDLSGHLEEDAKAIVDLSATPGFRIFRTILWKPSQHAALIEAVKRSRPDVEFVTPPVLLELLRRSLLASHR